MRTTYRILGGLLVLGALAYGAVKLRPSVALTHAPLVDLMDACAEAALQKSAGPVSGHLLVPVETGYRVARLNTDVAPVTLLLQFRHDSGELFACRITGEIWANEASVRAPELDWANAQPKVAEWFARRLQQPGHLALPLDGPYSAAYCPGDGREGLFLKAGPGEYGSLSSGMPDTARPLFINFTHTANNPTQACEMVAQGG
jgi:hypothetical protein